FSSRRRHTRFSRDWSSNVCSSDLACTAGAATNAATTPKAYLNLRISFPCKNQAGSAASYCNHQPVPTPICLFVFAQVLDDFPVRSEERRVGKECSVRE